MLRILHSVSNMDRAGIETMLMNYYRHIDREQLQFDFLCNKKKPGAYDEEIQALGGRIFRSPGLNPARFLQYQLYMQELFAQHPEYRILHGHNGAFAVYSLYGAKRAGLPVRIFHGHDTNLTRDLKYPLKLFCLQFLEANINQRWSCGVEAARFYYGNEVVQQGTFRVIHNAIEVERFLYDEESRRHLRQQYGLEHKRVLGHVGRFMDQKNHEFLIKLFAELHRRDAAAFLVLIGDGELMPKIQAKVKALGLDQAVLFVGNVPNVNEWYQAFDAFILPSHYEGLPVVGIEAQAAGLTCVFADTITKEIAFSQDVAYLSLNAGPEVWCQQLLEAFTKKQRPDNYALITDAGYNIKFEARKLQQLYMDLAGNGGHSA